MTFEEWANGKPTWEMAAEDIWDAAYQAGREAMRQECADHVFNMAQWDENNEQWVVLHRASTAIRTLK